MIRLSAAIAVATLVISATAQTPRADRDDQPGPPRGFRGPPGFHLMSALDADHDRKISASELENAASALKKLDQDKDGELSPEEIGWPPTRGFARGPGFRGFGGRRGRGGGFAGGRGFPRFGRGSQPSGPARRPDPDKDLEALSIKRAQPVL